MGVRIQAKGAVGGNQGIFPGVDDQHRGPQPGDLVLRSGVREPAARPGEVSQVTRAY
jgi:hypothetical protein